MHPKDGISAGCLGSTVRVADIDSGVAMSHPDLAANMFVNPGESGAGKETNGIDDDANGRIDDFRGWDFVNNDNNPTDDNEHGTHVAGTIAGRANNALGVAGVASFPSAVGQLGGAEDRADQGAECRGLGLVRGDRQRHRLRRHHRRESRQPEPWRRRHVPDPRQRDQEQAEHALRDRGRQRRQRRGGRQQRRDTVHSVRPRLHPRRREQDLRCGNELERPACRFLELRHGRTWISPRRASRSSARFRTTTFFSDNFETSIAGRWTTTDARSGRAPRVGEDDSVLHEPDQQHHRLARRELRRQPEQLGAEHDRPST